jgi:hypothetical protein
MNTQSEQKEPLPEKKQSALVDGPEDTTLAILSFLSIRNLAAIRPVCRTIQTYVEMDPEFPTKSEKLRLTTEMEKHATPAEQTDYLFHTANNNEATALFILQSPTLLVNLGMFRPDMENRMENGNHNSAPVGERYSGRYLFELCQKWDSVRNQVLSSDDLQRRLSPEHLAQLTQPHRPALLAAGGGFI